MKMPGCTECPEKERMTPSLFTSRIMKMLCFKSTGFTSSWKWKQQTSLLSQSRLTPNRQVVSESLSNMVKSSAAAGAEAFPDSQHRRHQQNIQNAKQHFYELREQKPLKQKLIMRATFENSYGWWEGWCICSITSESDDAFVWSCITSDSCGCLWRCDRGGSGTSSMQTLACLHGVEHSPVWAQCFETKQFSIVTQQAWITALLAPSHLTCIKSNEVSLSPVKGSKCWLSANLQLLNQLWILPLCFIKLHSSHQLN